MERWARPATVLPLAVPVLVQVVRAASPGLTVPVVTVSDCQSVTARAGLPVPVVPQKCKKV